MKNFFEQGVSFRTFMLNQGAEARSKFMKYYIPLNIREEYRTRISRINSSINILAIAEGECSDCHINLSILEKLISTNKNISISLITKSDAEENIEAFRDYTENSVLRVPTFIFLDENFIERAVFIEKPDKVKKLDIDTVEGAKVQMCYKAGKLADETALELLLLLEKTA